MRPTRALWVIPMLPILSVCSGDGGTGPSINQVQVSPASPTLVSLGEDVQFSASVLDGSGGEVTGQTFQWESSDVSVATIASNGLATAVKNGSTTIRATVRGVMGQTTLTVSQQPIAMTRVSGDGQAAIFGRPLASALVVRLNDARGNPVGGRQVSFSVLDGGGTVTPSAATTDQSGQAATSWTLGSFVGNQRARTQSGGLSTDFSATATEAGLEITTATLDAARVTIPHTAQLAAGGGSESGYTWSLAAGSLPAGLTLSSAGVISGTPSASGTSNFTARVADTEGGNATKQLSLTVCDAPVALAVGGSLVVGAAPPGSCGIFIPAGAPGDRYRVSVLRPGSDGVASDVVDMTLSVTSVGTPQALAPTPAAASSGADFRVLLGLDAARFERAVRMAESTSRDHARLREEEAALLARLGREALLPPVLARSGAALLASQAVAPLRVMLDPGLECTAARSEVPAFLVGENADMAIYQDSVQRATKPITQNQANQLLSYYTNYGKGMIRAYFGEPSDVNGDGQIVVFATPTLPETVAGRVWSGDFFPTSQCSQSNAMEIVYFNTDVILGFEDDDFQALATLIHEVEHVVSLYRRTAAGSFHSTWIEEGRAEIAGELSSRIAWAATGGPSVTSQVTRATIQASLGGDDFTPEMFGVASHMARTVWYLSSQPNGIVVAPDGAAENSSIYGSGWLFHRWLADGYAGASTRADSAFFRELTDSLATPGVAGIEGKLGKNLATLEEEFVRAITLKGTGAPAPQASFTSYDFVTSAEIFDEPNPDGIFPWPVTSVGENPSAPISTDTFTGPIGATGIRIHDFVSNGTGNGAEVHVTIPAPARVVVVRIR